MRASHRFLAIRLGHYRFSPGVLPTLVTLFLLPALIGLGVWQLERAAEKRGLQAQYDARRHEPPVKIGSTLQPAEEFQFYRVVVRGRFEPKYQILLDNRVHRGRVGYHVVTPLRIAGGDTRVLVNRGWVPLGTDRDHLPVIATPPGEVEVTGVAAVPAERVFALGEPVPAADGWPTVWQYLDLARYTQRVPFPVQPVVVLLDPAGPGGFDRVWGRLDTGVATHEGYAFQWFALAAALFAIYIFVNTRRAGGEENDD